jgi:hypothetical protein
MTKMNYVNAGMTLQGVSYGHIIPDHYNPKGVAGEMYVHWIDDKDFYLILLDVHQEKCVVFLSLDEPGREGVMLTSNLYMWFSFNAKTHWLSFIADARPEPGEYHGLQHWTGEPCTFDAVARYKDYTASVWDVAMLIRRDVAAFFRARLARCLALVGRFGGRA